MDLRDLAVTLFGEREVLNREAPFQGVFARGVGTLLRCAYPALEASAERVIPHLSLEGLVRAKAEYASELRALVGPSLEEAHVRKTLRVYAEREKVRIAIRELMPDVSLAETARELSDLADATIALALDEALLFARRRMGGGACPFCVLGMGKLGGRELNPGSDVDLVMFYETDEGESEDGTSMYEYFSRVAQRMVRTLDEVTEDGFVWRVDLRLRPEGEKGPLVNSLPAMERYYESFGRTWERAAFARQRVVAGDPSLGEEIALRLEPFVYRRTVDPRLASELGDLLHRARAESRLSLERDIKIGPGGIRDAEFFVQALQLIWGGRDKALRVTNTLSALSLLHREGYVSEREAALVHDGYLFLRRLEHRIHFATGQQTHRLPEEPSMLDRLGRSLGFQDGAALERFVFGVRKPLHELFDGLRPTPKTEEDILEASRALDASERLVSFLAKKGAGELAPEIARWLLSLTRHQEALLGEATRTAFPALGDAIVTATLASADPALAAQKFARLFGRMRGAKAYAELLTREPNARRRLLGLLGASALLGDLVVSHPELLERVLFFRRVVDPVNAALDEALAFPDDLHREVGAMRRAKAVATLEIGIAELFGEIEAERAQALFTELAERLVSHALALALSEKGAARLCVVAMGKFGGLELGYGSDLDLFFVYDDETDPELAVRVAQRVLFLLGAAHEEGPGYELDTRLRPSGNQGLLVVSLSGFSKYQEERAVCWERQALVRARVVAGDRDLGVRVARIAEQSAYERGAAPPDEILSMRLRMQRELGEEGDLKFGPGGLVDAEFAVQWLQMKHGTDPRVRTPTTRVALGALSELGYLNAASARVLCEGLVFLRSLEQRLRMLSGKATHVLPKDDASLIPLARRMGIAPEGELGIGQILVAKYRSVTERVRRTFLEILDVSSER